MKYRLRGNFSTNNFKCLTDILENRGVKEENIKQFLNPTFNECENSPYDLDNIDLAAKTLLFHLQEKSKILILIDCD